MCQWENAEDSDCSSVGTEEGSNSWTGFRVALGEPKIRDKDFKLMEGFRDSFEKNRESRLPGFVVT